MIDITADQIAAAKDKDASMVEYLVGLFKVSIQAEAAQAATTNGVKNYEDAKDFSQEATIALWLGIGRFTGTTGGEFRKFAHQTIVGAISDSRKGQRSGALSVSTVNLFEKAVRFSGGDTYAAEQAAQTSECLGARRMTAETAREARLNYQGAESYNRLDGSGHEIGDSIEDETAGDPADLYDPRSSEWYRREGTILKVWDTLSEMDNGDAELLRLAYGVEDRPELGTDAVADLAVATDIHVLSIPSRLDSAEYSFAEIWTGEVAEESDEPSKPCAVCKVTKPLTDYYADKVRSDGYKGECKRCLAARSKANKKARAAKQALKDTRKTRSL